MITKDELQELFASTETYRIERTVSTTDKDKFGEAVCAFANDMPDSGKPGYLLIGTHYLTYQSLTRHRIQDDALRQVLGVGILIAQILVDKQVLLIQDGLLGTLAVGEETSRADGGDMDEMCAGLQTIIHATLCTFHIDALYVAVFGEVLDDSGAVEHGGRLKVEC